MTKYGFVIDQNACIGCHACTIACKSENNVPLGVFRTWVKYVEKGRFPNSRRHFLVERCNHCANAPCVAICPTKAMFTRADGIVDFDPARCIGCKACMQACPYDAIYIDPETHSAAKCNYCAHRTEIGLQPACVVACPEEAIISGDLDDPTSRISQLIGRENVRQRRPDQGTQPKLWYIGTEEVAINPEFFSDPQGSMWAQHRSSEHGFPARPAAESEWRPLPMADAAKTDSRGQPIAPGLTVAAGFLTEGGQVDYNVGHEQPWGFLVAAYLWTKSIGAGAFLVLALLRFIFAAFPFAPARTPLAVPALLIGLVFTGITGALLIGDLKHPERFLYIFTKSNFRSWLVWGAYILMAFGGLVGLQLVSVVVEAPPLSMVVLWPGIIAAALAAAYSGFLFGQAEGRDFWQSALLPPHLLVQAVVAGAAALVLVGLVLGEGAPVVPVLVLIMAAALAVHLLFVLAEIFTPHANSHVRLAVANLTSGRLRARFWGGAMLLGVVCPLAILAFIAAVLPGRFDLAAGVLAAGAAAAALVGLLVYEDVWVTAGQSVPMS